MPVYEITEFRGALSDYEDKGITGSFKFGSNLDVRKQKDTLSCTQALVDEAKIAESVSASISPSSSRSPSASVSPSISASRSPSASASPSGGSASISPSASASQSPSSSQSPSASRSPSTSLSPSASVSGSPSPSAGLLTTFADLIRFFVKATDGATYGFGSTGIVYKRLADASWSQVFDMSEAIKGATEWFDDAGKAYLYFAGNTTLHKKELPGDSSWNDVDADDGWPKTNLTSTDWHTMREAGGSLIIVNKGTLALVEYDNSYTNDALDLIPGNTARTLIERDGRSIIGTARTSNPTEGVNAMIDTEVPLSQVGTNGEVFYSNMKDTIPVKRFPGGGQVNPGGVANEVESVNFFEWEQDALSWIDKQAVGNMALFGVYGADSGKGGVYTIGRKNKNHPFVMNLEYLLDVDEIGAVTHTGGVTLISYRDGTDFGVKKVDSTTKATGTYEGLDFKAPVKRPVNITSWKVAEIFCDPLPSGASIEFHYKINKTGAFVQAKTVSGGSTYSTTDGKKAVFSIAAEGEIFEPRVVLNPTGNNTPEVHRIRVYFD